MDIFRYTMQCVYRGESLFPCAFNQEPPADDVKVFFDYVFRTKFRRSVSERLALALYAQCDAPFLFKSLGIFETSDDYNCIRVSHLNGETFLAASRDISEGEVVNMSRRITIPKIEQDGDPSITLRLMNDVDISNAHLFREALECRRKAMLVRPEGGVVEVNSKLDPDLDARITKYAVDRAMGITDFHVGMNRLRKESGETDSMELEEMYEDLYQAHFEGEC